MKLSIVVPSFNQAKFLTHTLESLANQRNIKSGELEIIVMDGGSTDGSVEILERFAGHLDYWVSEPDRGQTHALLKGFSHATGSVLGWLCSDDLLEPDAVRFTLDYFAQHDEVRFFYGDALWIDEGGAVLRAKKEIPFNRFIWNYDHCYIPQPSAFWRRSLYQESGGLDETLHLAMDSDLWVKFAHLTRPRHVRRPLSRIRVHTQAKTQRFARQSLQEHREICRRAGASFDDPLVLAARHAVAKSMRVTWKLAMGCYW